MLGMVPASTHVVLKEQYQKALRELSQLREQQAPPPSSRTKWTRRVPHPVLIGHAASLTPY